MSASESDSEKSHDENYKDDPNELEISTYGSEEETTHLKSETCKVNSNLLISENSKCETNQLDGTKLENQSDIQCEVSNDFNILSIDSSQKSTCKSKASLLHIISKIRSPPSTHGQKWKEIRDIYKGEESAELLAIQVKCLKEELTNSMKECAEKHDALLDFERRLKIAEVDRNQLEKKQKLGELRLQNMQKLLEDTSNKYATVREDLKSANGEIDKLKRCLKETISTKVSLERKLAQSTSEVENYQSELLNLKENLKCNQENFKKQFDELFEGKRAIEKQNAELRSLIKKQMQLIGNLKRQIVHVEASRALQLSEEEFMKAIEEDM